MAMVFIGVGSNIDPERNVPEALGRLANAVRITGISTCYRTSPLGRSEQQAFVNGVVEAETDLAPEWVKFDVLRQIEADLGRERNGDRYAPRSIDLDLLLYDDLVMDTAELTLPDPEITRRPFLAIPLCELAPTLTLPGGELICEIAAALEIGEMEPLPALTAALRKVVTDASWTH